MMNMITYRKTPFDDCLFIAELKGIYGILLIKEYIPTNLYPIMMY